MNCKYCNNEKMIYRIKTMANGNYHLGVYCSNCGRWQKWESQKDKREVREIVDSAI